MVNIRQYLHTLTRCNVCLCMNEYESNIKKKSIDLRFVSSNQTITY